MTEPPSTDPGYWTFAGRVDQAFVAHREVGDPVTLRLAALHGEPPAISTAAHSFSVVFDGAVGEQLPQGTYALEHPDAGRFLLFMVPVGIDGDSVQYEAVFTRLATP